MSGAMIAVHAAVAADAARTKIAEAFRVKGATASERAAAFVASRDNNKQSAKVRTLLIGIALALLLVGVGLVAILVQR